MNSQGQPSQFQSLSNFCVVFDTSTRSPWNEINFLTFTVIITCLIKLKISRTRLLGEIGARVKRLRSYKNRDFFSSRYFVIEKLPLKALTFSLSLESAAVAPTLGLFPFYSRELFRGWSEFKRNGQNFGVRYRFQSCMYTVVLWVLETGERIEIRKKFSRRWWKVLEP